MKLTAVLKLGTCAATLLLYGVGHASEVDKVVANSAAEAISEFRKSGDVSIISRFIPELQPIAENASEDHETRKAFLSIAADLLNAVYERADLRFNPKVQPLMNSSVPGGKYPPGTDPRSIKEPNLRAEYEKVLARDRSYAAHYTQQTAIFREIDRMAHLLCQTGKTEKLSEVRDALVAEGMRASYAEDFIRRLDELPPKP